MAETLGDRLRPVRLGLGLGLLAVLYGWGLGAAFGVGEDRIREGFLADAEASRRIYLEKAKGDPKAAADAMKRIDETAWRYFLRAHLHAGGIGSIAIAGSLLLSMLSVSTRLRGLASLLLGIGAIGYPLFWMLAGLNAPALGSTSAAKYSLGWLAIPSVGSLLVGAVLTLVLLGRELFSKRPSGGADGERPTRSGAVASALIALGLLGSPAQHYAQHAPGATPPPETLKARLDPRLPDYTPSAELSGQIRSVGADTMEGVMKLWISGFTKLHPGVRFQIEAKASGTAAPALTEGAADIAPVAREFLPHEIAAFEARHGYRPFAVRVAGGSYRTPGKTHAIAFFVNRANPIHRLTFSELDAIFAKAPRGGKRVVTWGELGLDGEWEKRPIKLYGVRRPNGIANFVQERVLTGGEFRDGIVEFTTTQAAPALDAIVAAVAGDPAGIGYAGFGNRQEGAKTLALAEREGGPYSEGSFQDVAARSYPLSRFVYVNVNRAPGRSLTPTVREFLRYVLSRQGQEAVLTDVFLPLSAEIVQRERARLE